MTSVWRLQQIRKWAQVGYKYLMDDQTPVDNKEQELAPERVMSLVGFPTRLRAQ